MRIELENPGSTAVQEAVLKPCRRKGPRSACAVPTWRQLSLRFWPCKCEFMSVQYASPRGLLEGNVVALTEGATGVNDGAQISMSEWGK